MRAAGNKTVQSGMTWDTFLPAQPKKQATDKKPPKPGKS
jgi:hypothetical protein